MIENLADRYRRWFEYEQDSHDKVLASLNAVPEELRASPSFQKAVDLMAHIVAARRMWLFRFGVSQQEPDGLFPQGTALADLPGRRREMHEAWSAYLNNLDPTALSRVFEYKS